MRDRKLWAALAAATLLMAPLAASAREESKIRLFMDKEPGSNDKGMLRSQLAPGSAVLRVHVNRLEPNHEHILMGGDGVESVEVARFMTNGSGNAEVRIDLFSTGDDTTPTFDPRGKLVTVNDGTNDVLSAWVYADPADDPARPRIKEVTSLAREAATQGTVDARYDALPSGGARLAITLRGVAAGDYDVIVDDTPVATLTPNASGFGSVDLRIRPGNGNGNGNGNNSHRPHKLKGQLPTDLNPRGAEIRVESGGALQFAGPMLAQIPGLGVCTASSASDDLMEGTVQPTATGSVTLGVEESCDLHMTLDLAGLSAGTYDLMIATVDVGDITIDATGAIVLEYDDTPAGTELAMPAGVASGAAIAIQSGTDEVLSGTLP